MSHIKNRKPELYVGTEISGIVARHNGRFHDTIRCEENNYRLASDGFIEITDEIAQTAETIKNADNRYSKQGVKLFFVCTFKTFKKEYFKDVLKQEGWILKFTRLGVPGDIQTFANVPKHIADKFHINKWYRLSANLENFHECTKSEPYELRENDNWDTVKKPCRICNHECYFPVDSLYVCDTCKSKIPLYEKVIEELYLEERLIKSNLDNQ